MGKKALDVLIILITVFLIFGCFNIVNPGYDPSLVSRDQPLVSWAQSTVTAPDASIFQATATDADGNVYAVGYQKGVSVFNYGGGDSKSVTGKNSANNALIVKYNSSGIVQWAQSVADGSAASEFFDIAVDFSSVYVVGHQGAGLFTYGIDETQSVTTAGDTNSVIVKYDFDGRALWARATVSGSGDSTYFGVAVDSTDVYAVGYQNDSGPYSYGNTANNVTSTFSGRNAVIVKYNSDGTALWARSTAEGKKGSGFYKAAADSNSVYVVGYQSGSDTYNFGNATIVSNDIAGSSPNDNAVIVKYDSNGNVQWARSTKKGIGVDDSSAFTGIAVNSSGVYTVGRQAGTGAYNYGDGISHDVAGANLAAANSNNALIVKYDLNGNVQWSHSTSEGEFGSNFTGIVVNSAAVYCAGIQRGAAAFNYGGGEDKNVTGSYTGENALIVKYNLNGGVEYAHSTEKGSSDTPFNGIAVNSGGVYVVGKHRENGTGENTNYGGGDSKDVGGKGAVIVKYRL